MPTISLSAITPSDRWQHYSSSFDGEMNYYFDKDTKTKKSIWVWRISKEPITNPYAEPGSPLIEHIKIKYQYSCQENKIAMQEGIIYMTDGIYEPVDFSGTPMKNPVPESIDEALMKTICQ